MYYYYYYYYHHHLLLLLRLIGFAGIGEHFAEPRRFQDMQWKEHGVRWTARVKGE